MSEAHAHWNSMLCRDHSVQTLKRLKFFEQHLATHGHLSAAEQDTLSMHSMLAQCILLCNTARNGHLSWPLIMAKS